MGDPVFFVAPRSTAGTSASKAASYSRRRRRHGWRPTLHPRRSVTGDLLGVGKDWVYRSLSGETPSRQKGNGSSKNWAIRWSHAIMICEPKILGVEARFGRGGRPSTNLPRWHRPAPERFLAVVEVDALEVQPKLRARMRVIDPSASQFHQNSARIRYVNALLVPYRCPAIRAELTQNKGISTKTPFICP